MSNGCTPAISAVNNNGDLGKVAKDITSKEALKNTAIAAAGGAVAGGILGAVNPIPITNNTSLVTNLKSSFTEVAAQTVGSTAAQSAINGDNFSDALKNQGKNILVYTVAKVAANAIGAAAHPDPNNPNTLTNPIDGSATPKINTVQQLALHGALGCVVAGATGNNCGSGAIAGVVGEMTAQTIGSKTNDNQTITNTSKLMGAISDVTYGNITNQSDDQIVNNTWEGSRIAGNAAENNYQSDVHRDLTKFLAEKSGFTAEQADAIANGNQGTDEDPKTGPFSSVEARANYHFTTPERRDEMRTEAFKSGDLQLFGQYLHALQDSYSHQIINIPFEENVGHAFFGTWPDKTYNRPELANSMALDTYVQMQHFLKFRDMKLDSPWIDVKKSINEFNQLKTNERKQNALQ